MSNRSRRMSCAYHLSAAVVLFTLASMVPLAGSSLAAEYKGQEVDSETPWEEKRELRRESTGAAIAKFPFRVLAWPGSMVLKGMEKGLLKVEEDHLLVWLAQQQARLAAKGYYPIYGGVGDGAGFGGGLRYVIGTQRPGDRATTLFGVASVKGFATFRVDHLEPVGPLGVRFFTGYDRQPQQDFFGLGPDSDRDDRSTYLQEEIDGGLGLELERDAFQVRTSGRWRQVRIDEGTDEAFPTTQELFTPADAPGLDEEIDFFVGSGTLTMSDIDNTFSPEPWSGKQSFEASYTTAVDGAPFDYRQYRAEFLRNVPILYGDRQLVVRVIGQITDRGGDEEAAFFDLPELGGSYTLRGFREHRFRGRDAFLLNVEYRWPIWHHADMALFFDDGSVFENIDDDFNWRDLETSWGGSMRLKGAMGVIMRALVGRSKEGTRFFLKFDSAF